MSQAVVRIQSPEEREYARYLAEIETRRRRIADLDADLAALTQALGRFEAEYHARVDRLFVELDRVRLAIDEYEQRIARLQSDPAADPAEVEEELQRQFRPRREEVRDEEAETRRYEEAFRRERERPALPPAGQAALKQLYRDLAKRFHPDLARTDEERRIREGVMQRVNAAFHERSLAALQAISQEAEVTDAAFEARSLGEKLVWAIREVARLDGLIGDLEAALSAIRESGTHRLWRRQAEGEAAVERLERDLGEELAAARERLAALVGTYRGLVERRTA